jgi:molecular chaperone DnaK (HSP70)
MGEHLYKVGIDLGTTNCAIAFIEASGADDQAVQTLEIKQIVHPHAVESKDLLPSFMYLPGDGESAPQALDLPWAQDADSSTGEFARRQSCLVPTRVVNSAKSWLCNPMVDRRKPTLPYKAVEGDRKISPVDASATYLKHLVSAWDYVMAAKDKANSLSRQDVILTVPASFDPAARELTVEAAKAAGLTNLTLIEEPQAAFYAWIESLRDEWRKHVKVGDLLLVCDVGGGTTDFTLISVEDNGGSLELQRIAVGNHILLGGDNMDLALAHVAKADLASRGIAKLDIGQFQQLMHACRQAKEVLLSDLSKTSEEYVLHGRGTKLVGGSIKGTIAREMANQVLISGFFPECLLDDEPRKLRAGGLQETGLPYASDSAVTKHLAAFVKKQVNEIGRPITGILFNGGVFKAAVLRDRVLNLVQKWFDGEVRLLDGTDLDQAVSVGAAYFGAARSGRGIRIRGGASKSYYLGVEIPAPAIPGLEPPIKALCVVPFGMENGTIVELSELHLGLVVGEPVRFRFFSADLRKSDKAGDWHEEITAELVELPALETVVNSSKLSGSLVPISLKATMTEIGTLELHCESQLDDETWKLEFEARHV